MMAKKFWKRNSAGLTSSSHIFVCPCRWGEEDRQVTEFMPFSQKFVHLISGGASWLNEHSASSECDCSVPT